MAAFAEPTALVRVRVRLPDLPQMLRSDGAVVYEAPLALTAMYRDGPTQRRGAYGCSIAMWCGGDAEPVESEGAAEGVQDVEGAAVLRGTHVVGEEAEANASSRIRKAELPTSTVVSQ